MSRQHQTTSSCTQGKVAVSEEVKELATKCVMCCLSASASKRSHLYTSSVCYCCDDLQNKNIIPTKVVDLFKQKQH